MFWRLCAFAFWSPFVVARTYFSYCSGHTLQVIGVCALDYLVSLFLCDSRNSIICADPAVLGLGTTMSFEIVDFLRLTFLFHQEKLISTSVLRLFGLDLGVTLLWFVLFFLLCCFISFGACACLVFVCLLLLACVGFFLRGVCAF